jgi:hypothetical protein
MVGRCAFGAHKRPSGALRVLLGVTLLTAVAHAGHAPLVPEPRIILLRDDEPEHVVIGTRQGGYFVTRDAGATWSWMCEAGVGYDDEQVYPGARATTQKAGSRSAYLSGARLSLKIETRRP